MNNPNGKVIPIHSNTESFIRTGSVISVVSDEIIINLAGNIKAAKKAFSCIIDLEPNDIVLCAENELVYVLGIIERPNIQKIDISFPSDTQIQVNQGNLNIHSKNNVTIASNNVNCFSEKVIHKSREAIISYDKTTASGDEIQASFKTVRLISNLINTMAKQVIDRFKGYIRSTEDNDMVKAGQMTRHTDGLHSVDSKHTLMKSKKTTIIDGEKILMG